MPFNAFLVFFVPWSFIFCRIRVTSIRSAAADIDFVDALVFPLRIRA